MNHFTLKTKDMCLCYWLSNQNERILTALNIKTMINNVHTLLASIKIYVLVIPIDYLICFREFNGNTVWQYYCLKQSPKSTQHKKFAFHNTIDTVIYVQTWNQKIDVLRYINRKTSTQTPLALNIFLRPCTSRIGIMHNNNTND